MNEYELILKHPPEGVALELWVRAILIEKCIALPVIVIVKWPNGSNIINVK